MADENAIGLIFAVEQKDDQWKFNQLEVDLFEPQTYEQAMSCTSSELWMEAMQQEINSQQNNNTWELEEIPAETKKLNLKWCTKSRKPLTARLYTKQDWW